MSGFQGIGRGPSAPKAQCGVSLFELLLVLTIMSLAAGIAGVSLNRALPGLRLRQAATVLEADLQRARTLSLTQGEVVDLTLSEEGYAIEGLGLSRSLADGVMLVWDSDAPLAFTAGVPSRGGTVLVTRGQRVLAIRIEAFTGRVMRDAPAL